MLSVGAGYAWSISTEGRLTPTHTVSATIRWDRRLLIVEGNLAYGFTEAEFPAWANRAHAALAQLRAGLGFDVLAGRLSLLGALGGGPTFQRYDDGSSRQAWCLTPGLVAGMA
jgi:hypothetical protein